MYILIWVVLQKESSNLTKVLSEPNQKSNGLSMNRKCGQRYTTNDRRTFTNVLGADKGPGIKVHCNCKLWETTARMPCLTAKVAFVRVKNVTYIYVVIIIFISRFAPTKG